MQTYFPLIRFFLIALALALGAGCTSTPQASAERDTAAKQFGTHPGSSTIYVFRADLGGHESDDHVLWVDNKLIGSILPRTYFRINVEPGVHTFNGMGADNGRLTLETRPGELYFVSMTASAGNSLFRPVAAEAGRREIAACCALMENWAPGQRPLLR